MRPSMDTDHVERAPTPARPGTRWEQWLAHPVAFLATAAVLFGVFGWTFISNPERLAPTKDPAYYTWRIEALITEEPVTLLEVEGAFDMYASGYRVSAAVIGGLLRQIPDIGALSVTSLLMVVIPVITALLMGGFAFRVRGDPLIFHLVTFGVASLYLTPPFVGYLDNILCLLFLAAAVWFIAPARTTWAGRVGLFLFLLASGFTHPTSLAIFCAVLGIVALLRLLAGRFDLRRAIREDGPMLATALASAVATGLIWQLGIWGESASLGEAALPPPYESSFFVERMMQWIGEMRPALNGPLIVAGLAGILAGGIRGIQDELSVIVVAWLAPLVGLFGFLGGLTYPYYRFFNTTLSWVVLVGLGGYVVIRFVADRTRGSFVTLLVALAIVLTLGTNLAYGLEKAGWNEPTKGWMSSSLKRDLDFLRSRIAEYHEDTPVIFVVDDKPGSFQIWSHAKLSGNQGRYALPKGHIDRGYLYLGALDNLLAERPTEGGEATYDKLSPALLDDAQEGIEEAGRPPVVVVVGAFNPAGQNAELFEAESPAAVEPSGSLEVAEVIVLDEGEMCSSSGGCSATLAGDIVDGWRSDWGDLGIAIGGLALLMLPGLLAFRWFLPGATFAEGLGMVPALSLVLLCMVGIAVLSVAPSLSRGVAWVIVLATTGLAMALAWRRRTAYR